MFIYRIGLGHDVDLVDLVPIVPQPTSGGVRTTRRTYAADGSLYEEASYCELIFNVLNDAEMYQDLINMFGVLYALTAPVTIYVRDPVWTPFRYNGTAIRPETSKDMEWSNYFPRNITILIRDLVLLEEP